MAITVKVYDYDTAALLENRVTNTVAEIRYTGRNDSVSIEKGWSGDAHQVKLDPICTIPETYNLFLQT